jgi:hypothetical protein
VVKESKAEVQSTTSGVLAGAETYGSAGANYGGFLKVRPYGSCISTV